MSMALGRYDTLRANPNVERGRIIKRNEVEREMMREREGEGEREREEGEGNTRNSFITPSSLLDLKGIYGDLVSHMCYITLVSKIHVINSVVTNPP